MLLQSLRAALVGLYDPSVLRSSPLIGLLGLEKHPNKVAALREVLSQAIETLRPGYRTPADTRNWRVYQILRRRYIEQIPQSQVALDLGLSVRQLQREEKLSRQELAAHLMTLYRVEYSDEPEEDAPDSKNELREAVSNELDWIKRTAPSELTDVGTAITDALNTVGPLIASLNVSVSIQSPGNLPQIFVQPLFLRQAMLNLLSEAIQLAPDGKIDVSFEKRVSQITLGIKIGPRFPLTQSSQFKEDIALAMQLLRLCGGTLDLQQQSSGVKLSIHFDTTQPITVLVIDDNEDTLQLFERYLSGSRYRFLGARDASMGLSIAQTVSPDIVIIDLMMPEQDGWIVLSQLREHPKTQNCLLIVCTILPQEELALTLGADDYIQKPVSRSTLLAILEHHLAQVPTESH